MIIRDIIIPAESDNHDSSMYYQVRCCHCPPTRRPWGPYHLTFKTTSHYIRHFESKHPTLPRSQEDEEKALRLIQRKQEVANRNRWRSGESAQATGTAKVLCPREPLDEGKYRQLLAAFIVETNSTLGVVESPAFNSLIKYCNASAPFVSWKTTAADVKQLYRE